MVFIAMHPDCTVQNTKPEQYFDQQLNKLTNIGNKNLTSEKLFWHFPLSYSAYQSVPTRIRLHRLVHVLKQYVAKLSDAREFWPT